MRILEILIIILIALCLITEFWKKDRWLDWLSIAMVIMASLQLAVEGYRWQMVMGYALTALGAAVSFWAVRPQALEVPQRNFRKVRVSFGIVGGHRQLSAQHIHSLNIEMIVDRDIAPWAYGKKPEAIFGRILFGPGLRQPFERDLFHRQHL